MRMFYEIINQPALFFVSPWFELDQPPFFCSEYHQPSPENYHQLLEFPETAWFSHPVFTARRRSVWWCWAWLRLLSMPAPPVAARRGWRRGIFFHSENAAKTMGKTIGKAQENHGKTVGFHGDLYNGIPETKPSDTTLESGSPAAFEALDSSYFPPRCFNRWSWETTWGLLGTLTTAADDLDSNCFFLVIWYPMTFPHVW